MKYEYCCKEFQDEYEACGGTDPLIHQKYCPFCGLENNYDYRKKDKKMKIPSCFCCGPCKDAYDDFEEDKK